MKGMARVQVLMVTGFAALMLLGAARIPAVYEVGASAYHTILRHEKMPTLTGEIPVGFYEDPCGDGLNAAVTVSRGEDGSIYGAYYLADLPDKPWGIVVRKQGEETVILLDYNRDGYVDEKTTPDVETCAAQAKVKKVKKASQTKPRHRVVM